MRKAYLVVLASTLALIIFSAGCSGKGQISNLDPAPLIAGYFDTGDTVAFSKFNAFPETPGNGMDDDYDGLVDEDITAGDLVLCVGRLAAGFTFSNEAGSVTVGFTPGTAVRYWIARSEADFARFLLEISPLPAAAFNSALFPITIDTKGETVSTVMVSAFTFRVNSVAPGNFQIGSWTDADGDDSIDFGEFSADRTSRLTFFLPGTPGSAAAVGSSLILARWNSGGWTGASPVIVSNTDAVTGQSATLNVSGTVSTFGSFAVFGSRETLGL